MTFSSHLLCDKWGGRWDWLRCILHRLTPIPTARRRGASKLLRKKLLHSLLCFPMPMPTNKFVAWHKKNKKMSYDIFLLRCLGGRWDSNPRP